ncbi:MAG TPA: NUDIX hydrolase [Candidatus Dojkabacteria bacterium]|nr:NUDIX hydrolase [Candidatus Dojkabacteria bacterium]
MEKNPVYNEADLKDHLGIWLWLENEKGEILMFYHKKFGCWTIPLEKSDPGETLNEAILRTGTEELGIDIANYEIVHTQGNSYIRDGNRVNVEASLVKVLCYDNEITNMEPDKHLEVDWKSKEFILKLEDSTDAVKALQEYIK